MRQAQSSRSGWVVCAIVASLCLAAFPAGLAGQNPPAPVLRAEDAAGFKEFTARVQAYVRLQKSVESKLPALKATDVPEMITAHQQAFARTIREARPRAKAGDVFTSGARDAFRRVGRAALAGPRETASREYMRPGEASPTMRLTVNGIYPEAEPITAIPPALLAAFPPLPAELAYRVVGQTLVLLDVKSRMIVDIARDILKPRK
jgi:hypothetical protein